MNKKRALSAQPGTTPVETGHSGSAASSETRRRRLTILLSVVFGFALLMGPGPGLYLVNPDPSDPTAQFTVMGIPIIYAWAVFWFAIQAGVVVVAYRVLWKEGRSGSSDPHS